MELPDTVKYTILHYLKDSDIDTLKYISTFERQSINLIVSSDYFWIDRLNVMFGKTLDSATLDSLKGTDFKKVYTALVKHPNPQLYYTRGNFNVVAVRLAYKVDSLTTLSDLLASVVDNGHLGIVRLMLEYGTPVNANKNKAILQATMKGNTEMVKLLLSYGADATLALKYGVAGGYMNIVKLALDYGGQPSQVTDPYLTAAASRGFDDIVQLIDDLNAN